MPYHPLLFAIAPILAVFNANVDELRLSDLWWPVFVAFAFATAITAVIRLIAYSWPSAALGASIVLIGNHLFGIVRDDFVRAKSGTPALLLMLAYTALLLAVLVPALRARVIKSLTSGLNLVGAVVVIAPLVVLTFNLPHAATTGGHGASGLLDDLPSLKAPSDEPRDIYFLVMDRYAGSSVLEAIYEVDNEPFYDALESLGFVVSPDSRANYTTTVYSMASSLNGTYLTPLADAKLATSSLIPLHDLIRDNAVVRALKGLGYEYDLVGSAWDPSATSPLADREWQIGSRSGFADIVFRGTLLGEWTALLGAAPPTDWREFSRASVEYQRDQLIDLPDSQGPKFVFAHFLLPHEPYVFDSDGSWVPVQVAYSRSKAENYRRQLDFTNDFILGILHGLLDGVPDARRPIIVLQSDEGPYQDSAVWDPGVSWLEMSDDVLGAKYPILSALLVPGVDPDVVPPDLAPVNTFRLLFNQYFGTELSMVENRQFASPEGPDMYQFVDVTDRVDAGLATLK